MMRSLLLCCLFGSTMAHGAELTALEIWRTKIQGIVPRNYVCQWTDQALNIDGKVEAAEWAAAPWTDDFEDIEGDAKPKPTFRTRAKMMWDAEYLYICAEMEEPHVWGTITKHDEVMFMDPDFEVFIDPDGDTHEYYEFEMNALNTGWDLFLPKPYKDGGKADNSWEIPGLKTAVDVQGTINDPSDKDVGWSVELAIPWKVLAKSANRPAPPAEGDQWRLGFSRVEWIVDIKDGRYVKRPGVPEPNWIWSRQGVVDMHRPETWGYVQFTRRPSGEVRYVPDSGISARIALMDIYYAQIDHFKKHGKWATDFGALGMTSLDTDVLKDWTLSATADGYACAVTRVLPGGKGSRWSVRQDSKLVQLPNP